jgi:ABC-2 type transport system permease protein
MEATMAEDTGGSASRAANLPDSIYQMLGRNPIVLRELRGRMHGGRAFIILTVYLVILTAMVALVYIGYAASGPGYMAPEIRQNLGKIIFGVVVMMELLLVIFISPGLTAGAISSEREQQTFDLLRTTLLSARSLVFGKLLAALSFILLLLLAAMPLQSIAFFFGGVTTAEYSLANLLLVVSALAYTTLGLLFSSLFKRTLVATILAYACTIFIVFGLPILVYALVLSLSVFLGNIGPITPSLQGLLVFIGWLIISVNPLATALVTEYLLIEEQSIFIATLPLIANTNFPILSPWIGYTLIYLVLSYIFMVLSIHITRQVER